MQLDAFHAELAARPRLRGRLHLVAAFAAVVGLVVLVASARSTQACIGAWIYGTTSVGLYAVSATYHVLARSPRLRSIMQRADHAMIYLLIAGTFTPIVLVTLHGSAKVAALTIMWLGATVGIVAKMAFFGRFDRFGGALYIVLGWAGLMALPALWPRPGTLALIAAGGILYTVGAALFATKRPRWQSNWFGYHEVWHTIGISAGVLIFIANLHLVRAG